jgi:hypothetical protein
VTIIMDTILLFFPGIVGVHLARIYCEVRHRPTYIVSFLRRHRGGDANPRPGASPPVRLKSLHANPRRSIMRIVFNFASVPRAVTLPLARSVIIGSRWRTLPL